MSQQNNYPPLIYNIFKPAGMSSYDIVRHFKRNLPDGYGKIGHFGTLDPFASGVLMIGVGQGARINDYVHELCPKTYLAIGKLGVSTVTGDLTVEANQLDESDYLKKKIANFDASFIEEQLRQKFLGEYWQAPHKYSAAKFEGKALHHWAREGVDIVKEKKRRVITKIEVVKYQFPYLSIRFEVSSGTYIRTLFSDCANYLGTLGTLVSLVRESVGSIHFAQALKKSQWPQKKQWNYLEYGLTPDEVLKLPAIVLDENLGRLYSNGISLDKRRLPPFLISLSNLYWVYRQDQLLGMGELTSEDVLKVKFNFPSSSS